MAALQFLLLSFEVVLLFNFIILVHELGHFLAARWRGMKVDRFSIWFGKPLWKKRVGDVTYCLGSIPFGGFVSLPQLAPMEAIEGKPLICGAALPTVHPFDKIIVQAAGPVFSFLLALVFAAVVWAVGVPAPESEMTTVVGYVGPGSAAEKGGLKPGDRILSIDGHRVDRFSGVGNTVDWLIVSGVSPTAQFRVDRAGKPLTLELTPTKEVVKGWQRDSLRQINIEAARKPIIEKVQPNSPAERAGIKAGDVIAAVDGLRLYHPAALVDRLRREPGKPVELTVESGGATRSVRVTAELAVSGDPDRIPRLGIQWNPVGSLVMNHPAPWDQVGAVLKNVYGTLSALFSPKSDIKPQHLSGPVGILRIYYVLFSNQHPWRMALWFSVMLNVNLALMNLLPVPLLDGGHIVLSLTEWVRRKPLSESFVLWVQTCGAVGVIGFILYVTSFDLLEIGSGNHRGGSPPADPVFAPQPPAAPVLPGPSGAGRRETPV